MRFIALAAIALLAACSTDSPYREKSPMFLSGVEARPLDGGQLLVTSSGAAQDRPQLLAAWAMRKSAEATLQQGKSHFEVKSVRLGVRLPEVELTILPLGAAATGKGFYDAAAVKREAEAFEKTDRKLVPQALLPVASSAS